MAEDHGWNLNRQDIEAACQETKRLRQEAREIRERLRMQRYYLAEAREELARNLRASATSHQQPPENPPTQPR